jgi:cystathionine beta-synthase
VRYDNILQTIGNTPLIRLNRIAKDLRAQVYVKVESFNPGGSVKDRIGIRMIEEAERRGQLKPGGTIIESTSGNTGVGLAIAAAVKGYKVIFTITDKQSREKIDLLKAFGAEVIVCPTAVSPDDPRSYYSVARKLSKEIPNSIYVNQYDNPANPQAHYETTGPEIWRDTEGRITHLVGGLGTGGTISGAGKYLKEKNPKIKVIGVDPVGSLFYEFFHTGKVGEAHPYKVEGIGEDIFPTTLDFSVLDDVIQVTDKECFLWARRLAKHEGIFAGGSSGAAIYGAMRVAAEADPDALVVAIIPDTGTRNLSKLYNDEWMRENQFLESEIKLNAMDLVHRKQQIRGLIYTRPQETVITALKRMQELDISQMPVLEEDTPIGALYEDDIMQSVLQGKELSKLYVREIMRAPFPIVSGSVSIDEITGIIMQKSPAVFVEVSPGVYDILTKYDLVHTIAQVTR